MSNNRGLAEQHFPAISSAPEQPRPKIMRRPAQFTSTRPEAQLAPTIVGPHAATESEKLTAPPLAETAEPVSKQKAWQDDMRFGIAMLTIVVLVNVALMIWLPHMRPASVPSAELEAQPIGAVAEPQTSAPLTFYSKSGGNVTEWQQETPSHPLPPLRPGTGADSGPNQ